jgi:hypothetical protein
MIPTSVAWLSPSIDARARVHVAVLTGDFAAARIAATALDDRFDAKSTSELWIALRAGTELPRVAYRHPALEPAAATRDGNLPSDRQFEGVYGERCERDLRDAVATAVAGDGGPLAKVFAECDVFYISFPKLLFGILPRVTQHRAELADALRVYRSDITTYSAQHMPFSLVDDLAEYRDIARLAGDTEEADRMQAIISRHARVLADRDRTIAFLLLE